MPSRFDLSAINAELIKLITPPPMTLARLLPEIVDLIIETLSNLSDLRALSLTCKRLSTVCLASTPRTRYNLYLRTYTTPEYLLLAIKARTIAHYALQSPDHKADVATASRNGRDLLAFAICGSPLTFADLTQARYFDQKVIPVIKPLCEETLNGRLGTVVSPLSFRIATRCYEIYYQLFHRALATQLLRALGMAFPLTATFTDAEAEEVFDGKVRRNFLRSVLPSPWSSTLRGLTIIYRALRAYSYGVNTFVTLGLTEDMQRYGLGNVPHAPFCPLAVSALCIMDARRKNRELKVAIDELGQPLPEGWVDLIKDMMDVVPAAAQQVSGDRSIAALMFDFIIPNDLVDIGEES